jgi:hypothetical protein
MFARRPTVAVDVDVATTVPIRKALGGAGCLAPGQIDPEIERARDGIGWISGY